MPVSFSTCIRAAEAAQALQARAAPTSAGIGFLQSSAFSSALFLAFLSETVYTCCMDFFNEPVGIFSVILTVALVAPFLADKLGIPIIASMTLAGIVLGPELLGVLDATMFLQFMASLGTAYVFFISGTESRVQLSPVSGGKSLLFGAITFTLPMLAGFAFGRLAFGMGLAPSLLLGAFFASSGHFRLPLLFRKDVLAHPSARAGKEGADIARILSMLLLLFFNIVIPGQPLGSSIQHMIFTLVYLALIVAAVPIIARAVFRKIKADSSLGTTFILLVMFAASFGALLAGTPTYFGAFAAGLALAPVIDASRGASSKLDFIGETMFLPFLLIFLGISADFSSTAPLPQIFILIVGSVLFGLGSKIAAALTAGKILRYSRTDTILLLSYSASFASFSLVFASVATSSGLFSKPLLSGAIILVMVSSSLASLMARHSGSLIDAEDHQEAAGGSKVQPERILVALSKPATANRLVELACMAAQSSRRLLFPLAVITDTTGDIEARNAAETMLSAAVMRADASRTAVLPMTRTSVNPAEGILAAAQEANADTIVIGWNKAPRLSNAFFGSVIEQTVNASSQMVVIARAMDGFTASHMVLVAPPLCDRHPGFSQAISFITAVAEKSRAKVHLATLSGHAAALGTVLNSKGLKIERPAMEIPAWKDFSQLMKKLPAGTKQFVLLSARPSEPSWHPALEKLPHIIGEAFPDADLLMLYFSNAGMIPLDTSQAENSAAEQQESAAVASVPNLASEALALMHNAINQGRVRVSMEHTAISDSIFELVASAFPYDRSFTGKMSSRLVEILQRQPIEMSPGVLLVHERVPSITESIVCMGSSRNGLRISSLDQPIHIVVLIFVPEEQIPEKHLALLGKIAYLFNEKKLGEHLIAADTPEEVLAKLQ